MKQEDEEEKAYLDELDNLFESHNLSNFLEEIERFVNVSQLTHLREVLEDIRGNYRNLLFYMKQGVSDPDRDILYDKLFRQSYNLWLDLSIENSIKEHPVMREAYNDTKNVTYMDTVAEIKKTLEDFVSSIALTELYKGADKDEKEVTLYESHRQYMSLLFKKLFVSLHWSKQYAIEMRDMLLSPTVDSRDRQQIVSAITLGLFQNFDIEKFTVLLQVYQRSEDEYVKQRALVGWTISLNETGCEIFPEIKTMVDEVIDNEGQRLELLQLQEQIFYCAETDKESRKIQSEIIPNIMRHEGTLNINEFGVEEKDDDLQNIINPGASERAMEDVERSMDKMKDMMDKGTDIYFGGFSKMKKYPFFQDISNWFCPFYLQHPGLQGITAEARNSGFMSNLMQLGPFCNSDKYSFALTIDIVFKKLPPAVKEMMGGDALGQVVTEVAQAQPMYIRRMYLQDIYRFCFLYPQASNMKTLFPQDYENTVLEYTNLIFLSKTAFDPQKIRLERIQFSKFLFAHHRSFAPELLFVGDGQREDSVDYLKLCARYYAYYVRFDSDRNDIKYCKKVLALQPDDEKTQILLARLYFRSEDYDQASQIYGRLAAAHPGKIGLEKNYLTCLSNSGKHEEALKRLYKLYYDHPDADVVRLLAYNSLHTDQFEKSLDYYTRLTTMTSLTCEDFISAGYNTWILGRIQDTYQWFSHVTKEKFEENEDGKHFRGAYTLRYFFRCDKKFLLSHGISMRDMEIMADMVYSDC